MVLKNHPSFVWPTDTTAKLWRYMDLGKFLWFLEECALFFPRAHLLGDPFEASTPLSNIEDLRDFEESRQVPAGTVRAPYAATKKALLPHYLVSCWHMNEFESAAMWRLYGGDNAIALQTRFDRLASVLPEEFGLGCVRYIDYLTDRIPKGNEFDPIMYKRKSFEHEGEVRAVTMDDKLDATTMQRLYQSSTEDWKIYVSRLDAGISVPIDIAQMVEAVRVSPSSPKWLLKIVQGLIDKSGYSFPVEKSDLDRDPVY